MKTFDDLWTEEEQQGLLQRLRREYPKWEKKRRQRRMALAALAVVAVTIVLPVTLIPSHAKQYDSIACNRNGIANSHWVDVAGNILTIAAL